MQFLLSGLFVEVNKDNVGAYNASITSMFKSFGAKVVTWFSKNTSESSYLLTLSYHSHVKCSWHPLIDYLLAGKHTISEQNQRCSKEEGQGYQFASIAKVVAWRIENGEHG